MEGRAITGNRGLFRVWGEEWCHGNQSKNFQKEGAITCFNYYTEILCEVEKCAVISSNTKTSQVKWDTMIPAFLDFISKLKIDKTFTELCINPQWTVQTMIRNFDNKWGIFKLLALLGMYFEYTHVHTHTY